LIRSIISSRERFDRDIEQPLAVLYAHRALAEAKSGNRSESDKCIGEGLRLAAALAADFPSVPNYRAALALCHEVRGDCEARIGRFGAAEQSYEQASALLTTLVREHNDMVDARIQLGATCVKQGLCKLGIQPGNRLSGMGVAFGPKDKIAPALSCFDKAVEALNPVLEREQGNLEVRTWLQQAYQWRATAWQAWEDDMAALEDIERSSKLASPAQNPALAILRLASALSPGGLAARIRHGDRLARRGLHVDATAALAPLRPAELSGTDAYNSACAYALCCGAARRDIAIEETKRTGIAAGYATRSIELLRLARSKGLFAKPNALQWLRQDPDLADLRSDTELERFIKETEEHLSPETPR
jgi:tetratricopeptide (TPR) repeat protein